MKRSSCAISSVVLPVAFVGLAVVAAPEARSMADASWAARWVAQRTVDRAEALTEQIADAARETCGITPAAPLALYDAPNLHAAAFEPTARIAACPDPDPLAITFAPRPDLIDLPPPRA